MKLQLTDGMLCELPVPNFTKTGQLMRKVEVQIHLRRLVKCECNGADFREIRSSAIICNKTATDTQTLFFINF